MNDGLIYKINIMNNSISFDFSFTFRKLSGNLPEGRHLSLKVGELEFGSKNEDFVYGQNTGIISFQLSFEDSNSLMVEIDLQKQEQKIKQWIYSDKETYADI